MFEPLYSTPLTMIKYDRQSHCLWIQTDNLDDINLDQMVGQIDGIRAIVLQSFDPIDPLHLYQTDRLPDLLRRINYAHQPKKRFREYVRQNQSSTS